MTRLAVVVLLAVCAALGGSATRGDSYKAFSPKEHAGFVPVGSPLVMWSDKDHASIASFWSDTLKMHTASGEARTPEDVVRTVSAKKEARVVLGFFVESMSSVEFSALAGAYKTGAGLRARPELEHVVKAVKARVSESTSSFTTPFLDLAMGSPDSASFDFGEYLKEQLGASSAAEIDVAGSVASWGAGADASCSSMIAKAVTETGIGGNSDSDSDSDGKSNGGPVFLSVKLGSSIEDADERARQESCIFEICRTVGDMVNGDFLALFAPAASVRAQMLRVDLSSRNVPFSLSAREQPEGVDAMRELYGERERKFAAARKEADEAGSLLDEGEEVGADVVYPGVQYITPGILFGVLLSIFLVFVLLIGVCCMLSIPTPLRFPHKKIHLGKIY